MNWIINIYIPFFTDIYYFSKYIDTDNVVTVSNFQTAVERSNERSDQ